MMSMRVVESESERGEDEGESWRNESQQFVRKVHHRVWENHHQFRDKSHHRKLFRLKVRGVFVVKRVCVGKIWVGNGHLLNRSRGDNWLPNEEFNFPSNILKINFSVNFLRFFSPFALSSGTTAFPSEGKTSLKNSKSSHKSPSKSRFSCRWKHSFRIRYKSACVHYITKKGLPSRRSESLSYFTLTSYILLCCRATRF